jgi:hypothetical protein
MTVRYPDINPYDFIDAVELASDSRYVYLTLTVVSTVAPNIVNVALASDGEGILTSRDHPVHAANLTASGLGDFADITGTSGGLGNGTFVVGTILSDTQFTVTTTISNSSGGAVNFRYPAGSNPIGVDLTGLVHVTHNNVLGAIRDLDAAIGTSPSTGVSVSDFLLGVEPSNPSIVYALTYNGSFVTNETWSVGGTSVRTISYTFTGVELNEEIRTVNPNSLLGVSFVSYTDFLLVCDPPLSVTYTNTYSLGQLSTETWTTTATSKTLKTVSYTYNGTQLQMETITIYYSDGVTVLGLFTINFEYQTSGQLTGANEIRSGAVNLTVSYSYTRNRITSGSTVLSDVSALQVALPTVDFFLMVDPPSDPSLTYVATYTGKLIISETWTNTSTSKTFKQISYTWTGNQLTQETRSLYETDGVTISGQIVIDSSYTGSLLTGQTTVRTI